MELDEFEALFSEGIKLRDQYVARMSPWFAGASDWPPVIGFGLPRDDRTVPLVTLGLNPSNREIQTRRIPKCPRNPDLRDVEVQWKWQSNYFHQPLGQLDWFDKSDAFLQAALAQTHRSGIPHVDVASQPSISGFDGTYDKKATGPERESALQFLADSCEALLLRLLQNLVQEHGLKKVVVYGYVPGQRKSYQRGSATLKDLFWGADRPLTIAEEDSSDGVAVGRGSLRKGHGWLKARPELEALEFIFLAQGPSSPRDPYAQLKAAGTRIRYLGWL